MHDAVNFYSVIPKPRVVFDPINDSIDVQSKKLIIRKLYGHS